MISTSPSSFVGQSGHKSVIFVQLIILNPYVLLVVSGLYKFQYGQTDVELQLVYEISTCQLMVDRPSFGTRTTQTPLGIPNRSAHVKLAQFVVSLLVIYMSSGGIESSIC